MLITVVDAVSEVSVDLLVDVAADLSLAELLPQLFSLTAADRTGATETIVVDGRPQLLDATVGEAGLRDGSLVVLSNGRRRVGRETPAIPARIELRVISGVEAGTTVHATAGVVIAGSSHDADLILGDDARPIELALLVREDGSVQAIPPAPGTRATVDGTALDVVRELAVGDQIVFDDRIVEIAEPLDASVALKLDRDQGRAIYNRPPRILPPELTAHYRLPIEPHRPERAPMPWLIGLLPLAMSVTLALVYKSPAMLLFGLLTPLILFSSYFTNERANQKRYRRQTNEYRETRAQILVAQQQAIVDERQQRRSELPDPAEVGFIATKPTSRLWQRRIGDPTWLHLRLGTGDQESLVDLEDPDRLDHERSVPETLHHAPIGVALADIGVLGLAGEQASLAARWLCAQVAVHHAPRDAALYFLSLSGRRRSHIRAWEFLRWLPHAAPHLEQAGLRLVGLDSATAAVRIAELMAILDGRIASLERASGKQWGGPAIVVVLDGAQSLRTLPGVVRLLRDGPTLGVYSICIERDEDLLPEECHTVVSYRGSHADVRRQRRQVSDEVLPDFVSDEWLDWVSRALAPIEDANAESGEAVIPRTSRLLDVLNLTQPSASEVAARWALRPRSTRAVVGESFDSTFSFDLVADGPHGLIGGTTGSGKSEFLQTVVASLALANTPNHMNFVLIDFKGGAAFKDCALLPHTVGLVTDLDGHLVERALVSLRAELTYREHVLKDAGVKDLGDYQLRQLPPLPRLLIVVDEFAALARELPQFMSGLVDIAARGRSLGIHLLLGTQRPSGAISPEIQANTNLRVALRTTSGAESMDVIDSPDAGAIPRTLHGRAYARLGANALIPFQASRIGGPVPAVADHSRLVEPIMRRIDFAALGRPDVNVSGGAEMEPVSERTDLQDLVNAIALAAQASNISEPRRPWLDPLPAVLALSALADVGTSEVLFAREDRPGGQYQRDVGFSPDELGHLFIVGTARSGKSSALRSIAVASASAYAVGDLHIYAIDSGNGALSPLTSLPHVGAVVRRQELDRTRRLLTKLVRLLTERQALLTTAGVPNLTELRAVSGPSAAPAHVLVMLDSWDGFVTEFADVQGGLLIDQIRLLLREGASAGIHFVLTGDRGLLSGPLSGMTDDKLVLRMADPSDVTLAGLNPRQLPAELPNGRALRAGSGVELQIALFRPDLAPAEQSAAISRLGATLRLQDATEPERRPMRVVDLPLRYTPLEAKRYVGSVAPGSIFVGLGGEDAEPISFSPTTDQAFVVAGPSRSGRSNALHAMAESALEQGWKLVVLVPKVSSLAVLDGREGVLAVFRGTEVREEALRDALKSEAGPRLLVVDDAQLLREMHASSWLTDLIDTGAEPQLGFLIAGDVDELGRGFSGWITSLRRSARGLVLAPTDAYQGQNFNVPIARSDVATRLPLGRGYAVDASGAVIQVQLPVREEAA